MSDPLAGQRQAINERELDVLVWPDLGQGCPVKPGDIFKLRTCHIEITRAMRTRSRGNWIWIAKFTVRYPEARVYLLDRRGGYTEDLDAAIPAQDDPHASTLDRISPDDEDQAHRDLGPEPEPEGVPSHEIGTFTGDLLSQRRYEHEMQAARAAQASQSLEDRLRQIQQAARAQHVDVSSDTRVVAKRLESMERRLHGRAA